MIEIQAIQNDALAPHQRDIILAMCSRAYEEDMAPIFKTFAGATHLLGFHDEILVSHAL